MEIQIISGFYGTGKTTFLNKYLPLLGGKTVVILNEFGEISLDEDLIQNGTPVRELYAGCICCSLAPILRKEIQTAVSEHRPDRLIIEPSGIGKLSDIAGVCVAEMDTETIVLVDLPTFEECAESLGTFYLDQIRYAGLLLFSGLDGIGDEQQADLVERVRAYNPDALFYKGDWRELDRDGLLALTRSIPVYKDRILAMSLICSMSGRCAGMT